MHKTTRIHCSAFAIIAAVTLSAPALGQVINENAKLLASDGAAEDQFGVAIAINNGIVAIGAHKHGGWFGAAYLMKASTGEQIFKLQASDGHFSDFFGYSIDIDNGIVAVGSWGDDSNDALAGSAYLFDATTGAQLFKISPNDPRTRAFFGWSIAMDNGIVAVGAPNDGFPDIPTGSANLFNANTGVQIAKLVASDGETDDQFGQSIAIDNGIVAVGAHHDDDLGVDSGAAYLFNTSGVQLRKLLPNDGAAGDRFGKSIAIGNGIVAVGSYKDDDMGSSSGSVYIFDAGTGAQLFKLVPDDGASGDRFGRSVSISNGTVAVGAYRDDDLAHNSGSAYLFDAKTGVQLAKLLPTVGFDNDRFGRSIAVENGIIAVGAYLDDDNGVDAGAAYLFNDDFDTDRDGLPDRWEVGGVPYVSSDGLDLFYTLPGADPMHKDLYVEVDAMAGLGLSDAAISLLETAFANAPQTNPDGVDGITLHVLRDENNLPHVPVWATDGCWPLDFDAVRTSWYGSIFERLLSGDPAALLGAKAKAVRYCIVADQSGPDDIGGCGQRPGDNFVIFPGTGYSDEDQAAVFMHELGHNLGLQHGGGDSVNGKPNYPSVMNYVMSYRYTWNSSFWGLDYSRHDAGEFVDLDETLLDERAGIGTTDGFYNNFFMPYGVSESDGAGGFVRRVRYAQLDGFLVDFGSPDSSMLQDGLITINAKQDLNYVTSASGVPDGVPSTPSFGETLTSYDDWAHVNLQLAAAMGTNAPAPSFPTDELTTDGRDWIDANFPVPPGVCLADLNGDGALNFFDVSAFLTAFAAQDPAADFTNDGAWDFFDVSAFLTAFAGGCP